MGIYYTLFLDLQSRNNEEILRFSCDYNHCNNQSSFANIISKFDVHYQINDVLKTINSHKQSEESEEELKTTTATTATFKSTVNPQGNSGFKDTIHMAIFYISLIRFVLLY